MTTFGYPYRIDVTGRTAAPADWDAHVRQLIEQLLFTIPGERVNRPTFGSAAQALVFGLASSEQTTALEYLVQSALQQWLGDLIQVQALQARAEDSTLRLTVQYVVQRTQERRTVQFEQGLWG